MRILIVEDETAAYENLADMLVTIDPTLEIMGNTESVQQTVRWLQANPRPDLIFMDIMMPYMNGWDATRKIRTLQRPDADKIPIIAMSANAFAEDIINSHISGMNWHLTKPIDADKLMTALKECIRKNNIR